MTRQDYFLLAFCSRLTVTIFLYLDIYVTDDGFLKPKSILPFE